MSWFPMHSWHPVMVHVPLVGLLFAVVFDLVAVQRHSTRWREAATARNLILAAVAVLLITAIWRWRRPYPRGAGFLGLFGALGLTGAGYLGGDLVYRHAIGIPTETLEQIAHERGGHAHGHPDGADHLDTTLVHEH